MGCDGKVDFEALMAATFEMDGITSRLLYEYFRLVSTFKRRKITPTEEYLADRLNVSRKQVRTAIKKLVETGWISRVGANQWDRQGAAKRATQRATTTLLKYDEFLHSGAAQRAAQTASDVDVSKSGVTGVSSDVDVVKSIQTEVRTALPAQTAAPAVPLPRLPRPHKNPAKGVPGWKNLTNHVPAEFERVIKSPYKLTVGELSLLNNRARVYGAPQIAALWNRFMVMDDEWVRQTGRTVKVFAVKIPKLLEDTSYKAEAETIEKQWFPSVENELSKAMALIGRGAKEAGFVSAAKILSGFGGKEPAGKST